MYKCPFYAFLATYIVPVTRIFGPFSNRFSPPPPSCQLSEDSESSGRRVRIVYVKDEGEEEAFFSSSKDLG